MQVAKVIKMRLYPTNEQAKMLFNVSCEYRDVCNLASQWLFDNNLNATYYDLNKALYHNVREHSLLNSQMVQSAFKSVIARYKTVKTQLSKKPYRYCDEHGKWQSIKRDLAWLQYPIKFKRPQADLVRNSNWSFVQNGNVLSLSTLSKRIKLPFSSKGFEQLLDWHYGTAKLVNTNGHWMLHASVTNDVAGFNTQQVSNVVGIDRGLRFLATSFDSRDKTTFFDGKAVLRKRDKYKRLRQQLQTKNTKSSKRRLRMISDRENRWMSDVNHQISKTLVSHYGQQTLFVIEDLTNVSFNRDELSKKQRNAVRLWSFYQLEQFLTYKAHMQQSEVLQVSALYTSQRCPKCGIVCKSNRNHHEHTYHCRNCGYQSNDDRIGAMNIQELGKRYVSGDDKPIFTKSVLIN